MPPKDSPDEQPSSETEENRETYLLICTQAYDAICLHGSGHGSIRIEFAQGKAQLVEESRKFKVCDRRKKAPA